MCLNEFRSTRPQVGGIVSAMDSPADAIGQKEAGVNKTILFNVSKTAATHLYILQTAASGCIAEPIGTEDLDGSLQAVCSPTASLAIRSCGLSGTIGRLGARSARFPLLVIKLAPEPFVFQG